MKAALRGHLDRSVVDLADPELEAEDLLNILDWHAAALRKPCWHGRCAGCDVVVGNQHWHYDSWHALVTEALSDLTAYWHVLHRSHQLWCSNCWKGHLTHERLVQAEGDQRDHPNT